MQVAICQSSCLCSLSSASLPRAHRKSFSAWKQLFSQNRFARHSRSNRPFSFPPVSLAAASLRAADPAMEGEEWVSFPFLSSPGKNLMEDIAASMATELGSCLNPTRTPADVRHFRNSQGNGEGSVTLRSGKAGSVIDFVLGSWLHCTLPFGALNIATLIGMSSLETDAPHLLFEFIQTGPNSLVVVLDLLPRKDLVIDTEYLKRFYEDATLESIKQELQKTPGAQRYEPPTLYIRCLTSPTCIMYKFEGTAEHSLDQIVQGAVSSAAKNVVKVWLESVLKLGKKMPGGDTQLLLGRDRMIKTKGVEVDLSSNMPRLFGQEIADRVVQAFRRGE
ncbi:hypothetical protein GOP47_0021774 [Adiantum capillus-veneris]|uniref:Red chlorophyll catabolite reductase n=1 Tax=Adiantum capillus-veneris TaxID=13818 RepID=A0A9D4U8G1_ADICA|nr:hypothetical protein GOP47_0021774 [Adiantum capillus-veneris]